MCAAIVCIELTIWSGGASADAGSVVASGPATAKLSAGNAITFQSYEDAGSVNSVLTVMRQSPKIQLYDPVSGGRGELYWKDGKLEFSGDIGASAQVFLRFCREHMGDPEKSTDGHGLTRTDTDEGK